MASDASSAEEEDTHYDGFEFALVQPFVKEIRQTLLWEDAAEEPQKKQRKLFANIKREAVNFPFMEEIQDIIFDEWKNLDKKMMLKNRFTKLYLFKTEKEKVLEEPPVVDAAHMLLARHVTLPLDDAVSFKDVLDRRVDVDLKKIYTLAGGACRPSMA